jgi:hypothetical protein
MKWTLGRVLALAVVAFLLAYLFVPGFPQMLGIKLGETGTFQQGQGETGTTVQQQQGGRTTETTKACRLLGHPINVVNMLLRDKLSPRTGISGVTVEVFPVPADKSIENLARIASDPNRIPLDSAVSDATGKLTFNQSMIGQGVSYVYSVRGDSTVYDDIEIIDTPCYDEPVSSITHPTPKLVYKVGSFQDISTDSDNTLTASEYSELNLTQQAGKTSVFFSTDITIGEEDAGKVLKNPVLVIRYPEGYEPKEGAIKEIVIVNKMGTVYSIPGVNLVSYAASGTPIPLKDIMTVADSGTYTIKLTYDATLMESGKKVQFVLDDLGDYNAKDLVTRDTKAPSMSLTIVWSN